MKIIQGHLSDQSLPMEAQENVHRHYEHLTQLADSLKDLGIDQQAIDEHVLEIFEEYKRELNTNIQRIKNAENARRVHQSG